MKSKPWRKEHSPVDVLKDPESRVRPRFDMAFLDRSKYNGDGSKKECTQPLAEHPRPTDEQQP